MFRESSVLIMYAPTYNWKQLFFFFSSYFLTPAVFWGYRPGQKCLQHECCQSFTLKPSKPITDLISKEPICDFKIYQRVVLLGWWTRGGSGRTECAPNPKHHPMVLFHVMFLGCIFYNKLINILVEIKACLEKILTWGKHGNIKGSWISLLPRTHWKYSYT